MAISQVMVKTMQYLSEAVVRIFAPSDDAYPYIGIQPFTGEPYQERTSDNW